MQIAVQYCENTSPDKCTIFIVMALTFIDRKHSMKKKEKANKKPTDHNKDDLLDKLMERKNPDDLGLLDLLLVEEMMNQEKDKNKDKESK